jgi:putative DNA primase/helicase
MEFPELMSAILYNDCSAQIEREFPRLKALAQANGSNAALIMALNYFNQTKKSPTPEQLRDYAPSQPKMTLEHVLPDLEQAADWRKASPAGSFELAMDNAWREANTNYVAHGYRTAVGIAAGGVPHEIKTYQFEKRMKTLYGDDEANWDRVAFSQIWLNEYLAANPFTKREVEEISVTNEHEFELAKGIGTEGDEVVRLSLTAINATDIVPEQLKWLWPDRIAYGKICLYTGKPDCGKSLALNDLIARVTTGSDWADGKKNTWGPKDVMLACSEDDLGDTVVPRLNAAGADLKRVKFIHRVIVKSPEMDSTRQLQLASDTSLLKKALAAYPDVVLVGLDPVTSFFGDVNINADQEIRPVMDALVGVCNASGASLVAIIHHNKRSDVDALQKILGASSVAGAVRTAWGFSRDPDNKDEFFMSLVKNNLSKRRTGMKYKIAEKDVNGIIAPHTVWGEETEATANELLDAERDTSGRKDNKQITLARAFLPFALKGKGARPCTELYREAEAEGISVATLKRAKSEFPIQVIKRAHDWAWLWHEEQIATGEVF